VSGWRAQGRGNTEGAESSATHAGHCGAPLQQRRTRESPRPPPQPLALLRLTRPAVHGAGDGQGAAPQEGERGDGDGALLAAGAHAVPHGDGADGAEPARAAAQHLLHLHHRARIQQLHQAARVGCRHGDDAPVRRHEVTAQRGGRVGMRCDAASTAHVDAHLARGATRRLRVPRHQPRVGVREHLRQHDAAPRAPAEWPTGPNGAPRRRSRTHSAARHGNRRFGRPGREEASVARRPHGRTASGTWRARRQAASSGARAGASTGARLEVGVHNPRLPPPATTPNMKAAVIVAAVAGAVARTDRCVRNPAARPRAAARPPGPGRRPRGVAGHTRGRGAGPPPAAFPLRQLRSPSPRVAAPPRPAGRTFPHPAVPATHPRPPVPPARSFAEWTAKHGKAYRSREEHALRR
jgi:hypothetical protein